MFEKPFYMAMKSSLRPNGIISTQCESMWLVSENFLEIIVNYHNSICNVARRYHCTYVEILSRRRLQTLQLRVGSRANVPDRHHWLCRVHHRRSSVRHTAAYAQQRHQTALLHARGAQGGVRFAQLCRSTPGQTRQR